MKKTYPIIFIVGPTGSGKSNLAVDLAERIDGEIINGDSLQVYRELNIGTAKPSRAMFERVTHHLFDIATVEQTLTAGDYRRQGLAIIKDRIGKAPLLVVGGSGFYLQALEKGMFEVPAVTAAAKALLAETMQSASDGGIAAVFKSVQLRDPIYAASVSANDSYRIQRAFLILHSQAKTMTEIQEEFQSASRKRGLGSQYKLIKLGLKVNRDELRRRVQLRVEDMLQEGLVEEVSIMKAKGYGDCRPLQSVGYKETLHFINQKQPLEEYKESIVRNTMKLAKQQMTWFKRDSEVNWFDVLEVAPAKIIDWVEQEMS